MARSDAVVAVVVTHNRRELLLGCLAALDAQTHPLAGVLVVDNASSDGTSEALAGMNVDVLRLERNGGGAEGFHFGVSAARSREADWLWLMDDDCEPAPDALEVLLASGPAADPATALVAPLVRAPSGAPLALNRGWLRGRWFFAPLQGLAPEHLALPAVEVEHVSLVGPLVRARAAAATAPPRRDFFIWFDDLEWVSRLRREGPLWLIPASVIVHRDERPLEALTLSARWRDFTRGEPLASSWKRCYGLRNLIFCGRRDGFLNAGQAASLALVAVVRALLFGRPRLRSALIVGRYAWEGWRGIFRNLPPERWAALAEAPRPLLLIEREALAYD